MQDMSQITVLGPGGMPVIAAPTSVGMGGGHLGTGGQGGQGGAGDDSNQFYKTRMCHK
jgi:hypothetical protein